MKLRSLFESKHIKADVAFCFGRFNPPHQGHAKVWHEVKQHGHHWYIGTNPTTIGPDDPLPFNTKSAWMMAIDPEIEGHILGEQTVLSLAATIYSQLGDGKTITFVTDIKDWGWAGKLLHQYNGQKSMHGYYNFENITHTPSPRVMSATELRKAARAGNEHLFYELAGTDPNLVVHGKKFFETVAEACGLHPEKIKKTSKTKKVQPVEQEGLMGFMAKPTKKKVSASTEEMRKYFEKEKAKDPDKIERGAGDKKAQQVYTKTDENLVKYANKVIREMRAQEFMRKNLAEGDVPYAGKGAEELNHVHVQALKNAMSIPNISMNKANGSPYMQYRFGMAMANPDMPRAGAMSGDPLITAYTDADMQKVKDAAKSVGAGAITHLSDGVSNEADGGNTTSPVAKPKKNKYGV